MSLYFEIKEGFITQARFTAQACGPVVATGSLVTTLVLNKHVNDALELDAFRIDQALGGLPTSKRHAILMVLECLHEALKHQAK